MSKYYDRIIVRCENVRRVESEKYASLSDSKSLEIYALVM